MSDKLAERIFAGCKDRNWTAVELLLEELSKDTRSSRVATLNTKFSISQWSALHYTVKHGQSFICAQLLKLGANAQIEARDGTTALHVAVAHAHLACTRLLLQSGADPNQIDLKGVYAYDQSKWAQLTYPSLIEPLHEQLHESVAQALAQRRSEIQPYLDHHRRRQMAQRTRERQVQESYNLTEALSRRRVFQTRLEALEAECDRARQDIAQAKHRIATLEQTHESNELLLETKMRDHERVETRVVECTTKLLNLKRDQALRQADVTEMTERLSNRRELVAHLRDVLTTHPQVQLAAVKALDRIFLDHPTLLHDCLRNGFLSYLRDLMREYLHEPPILVHVCLILKKILPTTMTIIEQEHFSWYHLIQLILQALCVVDKRHVMSETFVAQAIPALVQVIELAHNNEQQRKSNLRLELTCTIDDGSREWILENLDIEMLQQQVIEKLHELGQEWTMSEEGREQHAELSQQTQFCLQYLEHSFMSQSNEPKNS